MNCHPPVRKGGGKYLYVNTNRICQVSEGTFLVNSCPGFLGDGLCVLEDDSLRQATRWPAASSPDSHDMKLVVLRISKLGGLERGPGFCVHWGIKKNRKGKEC